MTDRLPEYDELPVRAGAPPGSSWGMWPDGGVLGCLNLLTPERLATAAAGVRRGAVFHLDLELELPSPPLYGRPAFEHVVTDRPTGHDDELHHWNTQASSQWDGFRHIRHPEHGFYEGPGEDHHGMHHWARRGIAGRCVLADVARWRASVGRPLRPDTAAAIEPEDLTATLAAEGVEVMPGDILLIRTGWLTWYRGLDPGTRAELAASRLPESCGLATGEHTARLLWNLHVAAVAADNPALEAWPPPWFTRSREERAADAPHTQFLHFSLLPLFGMPIGELFDLDALAEDCAGDGRYDALFTSAPLNVNGGVASPPNALAIK